MIQICDDGVCDLQTEINWTSVEAATEIIWWQPDIAMLFICGCMKQTWCFGIIPISNLKKWLKRTYKFVNRNRI